MTLDQARQVIHTRNGGGAVPMHEHAEAARVISNHYLHGAGRGQTRPCTDAHLVQARASLLTGAANAARKLVTDAAPKPKPLDRAAINRAFWDRLRGRRTTDALNPGAYVSGNLSEGSQGALENLATRAGPVNIMKLDGSVAEFDIIENAQGEVWLVRFPLARGQLMGGLPVGKQNAGDHPRSLTADQITAMRRKEVDAENARTKAINQRNADYWATGPRS
jgi:hypothetical protein